MDATERQHHTDAIVSVTLDTFEEEVIKADRPTIVDFWAPWCGVCRAMEPTIRAFAEKQQDRVKIVTVNAQDALDIARQYGVRQLPTFIAFLNGEVISQHVGRLDERELAELVGITA